MMPKRSALILYAIAEGMLYSRRTRLLVSRSSLCSFGLFLRRKHAKIKINSVAEN